MFRPSRHQSAFQETAEVELRRRAEAARLLSGMNGNLLHSFVVDPHQAAVPPHPNLSGQVLRRNCVVGSLDLDMAVAVHGAALFVK